MCVFYWRYHATIFLNTQKEITPGLSSAVDSMFVRSLPPTDTHIPKIFCLVKTALLSFLRWWCSGQSGKTGRTTRDVLWFWHEQPPERSVLQIFLSQVVGV